MTLRSAAAIRAALARWLERLAVRLRPVRRLLGRWIGHGARGWAARLGSGGACIAAERARPAVPAQGRRRAEATVGAPAQHTVVGRDARGVDRRLRAITPGHSRPRGSTRPANRGSAGS